MISFQNRQFLRHMGIKQLLPTRYLRITSGSSPGLVCPRWIYDGAMGYVTTKKILVEYPEAKQYILKMREGAERLLNTSIGLRNLG